MDNIEIVYFELINSNKGLSFHEISAVMIQVLRKLFFALILPLFLQSLRTVSLQKNLNDSGNAHFENLSEVFVL